MNTLVDRPPAVASTPDPAIWYRSTAELTDYVAENFSLAPRDLEIVTKSLQHIDDFYRGKKAENVRGEMIPVTASPISPDEGRALMQLAVTHQVRRSLEIGFSFGMSTSHLLAANYIAGGEQHTSIDPFQLSQYYQGTGLKNVYNQNFGERFRWIKEKSNVALPELLAKKETFDLVFIDGSHLFSDTFIDAYYAYHLLPVGGLMIFDDRYLAAVRTVVNIMRTNFGCASYAKHKARDFDVLVKTEHNRLDWCKFDTEFAPFEIAR